MATYSQTPGAPRRSLRNTGERSASSEESTGRTLRSHESSETDSVEGLDLSAHEAGATRASRTEAPRQKSGRLTGRGAFFFILVATALSCSIGFLVSGATFIPVLTGWGLVVSTLIAAAFVREPDKLVALWSPPLAMGVVVAVFGQVTLLGSTPTLAREVSMFLAAMASSAPLQVLAVAGSFLVIRWRFRKPRKAPKPESVQALSDPGQSTA